MSQTPREVIEQTPMGVRQWIAVVLMIALNALDGFDVLSSAFAAPGIAKEWGIQRDALGVVLSMELVGMGFGSILLGGAADRFGRRPTILGCLLVMATGMWLATTSASPSGLALWRFITGLGIGGMLAAINAVTAEFSSLKGRSLAMALMVIGYPIGATVGGTIAGMLLKGGDWRLVFEFGAIATAVFIPLVFLFVPETPDYYVTRREPDALDKVNASLRKLALPLATILPPAPAVVDKPSVFDIFKPGLIRTTLLFTLGYSFHAVTFYYILKWSPKIVADFGYTQPEAASVLVWANIGGATGGALFGFAMHKFGLKWPTIAMLVGGAIAVVAFGFGRESLDGWKMAVFFTGFTTNAAIVGFYALFAKGFPTHVRATGTGFAIGAGRIGAAGSPILAGVLFTQAGLGLLGVSVVMAMGSVVAALLLLMLRKEV
ncbi:major facilitator superfamily MFS_1 [Novosphingobium aromaticivorans DSM 12444]|uniref:Major facilitator superfamily MFS_1 n=1 Tax=Novosphingobium aromaticivorans (strain ATCC 700278 / DSM 12444 / CCUG 56034 / CIP 105152 / NBRC 16084 / F199) TaxID=279238 RepID=Q2GA74_NOVAD|nr:MFS transporter [Novosphingobium aromaticivorans]ABD25249.1 major facilitator superfamily MFS_1 [Novosphingobium aromaticivorans DSM 12444]SCX87925.1 benzoate transport [Novosphingobium aromaticivorans]